jgi:uncharacterized protein YyaL (SSP411 family)
MTQNLLANETSPYLLQHADNPVHWYPWGDDALARARAEGKPILLSIGYAACHWCHVMAHESFEDPDTAEVMNRLFINIKVDREERPDLDAIYQAALSLMGEQGGWPLTMFCTPDGAPFWGGTYFPPRAGFGRPGFPDLLEHIDKIYRTEADKVKLNTTGIVNAIQDMAQRRPGDIPLLTMITAITKALAEEIDREHGGFGTAPKFPQCAVLMLMWAYGNHETRQAVLLTANRMAQGGIYDHLGGGFARYVIDPAWLVPHFEKMLYDNAQFLELCTAAWRGTGDPLYRDRVSETVTWLLRDMTHSKGGFYSTLDANSEGVEGKFYVWSDTELREILGTDFDLFAKAYDVTPEGNWDGHSILNRTRDPARKDPETESRLAALRATLHEHRETRIPPALNDKILTDWNGLMITALVDAAMTFDRPDWLAAARRAYAFVRDHLVEREHDSMIELHHSWRSGDARHRATLDDYAAFARAALALHEATGEAGFLRDARALMAMLDMFFADQEDAYFFTDERASDVIVRTRTGFDNATPAGNGIAAEVLVRLFYLTGENSFRDKATHVLSAFAGDIETNAFGYATLLRAAGLLADATQIAIIASHDDPATTELRAAAFQADVSCRIVMTARPEDALPETHPAYGKTQIDTAPTAYVCRGPVCSLPVTTPEALQRELAP